MRTARDGKAWSKATLYSDTSQPVLNNDHDPSLSHRWRLSIPANDVSTCIECRLKDENQQAKTKDAAV